MEDYKTLRDHLSQLAKAGKLNYFLHLPMEQVGHLRSGMYGGGTPQPTLGTIDVILTRPGNDIGVSSKAMSVVEGSNLEARNQIPKRGRVVTRILSFLKEDKQGTLQPHDDALVITIRIGGYDVKRVLVD